ncbi:CPBP family intramembrane glutamic endopeptidase [Paenibacillus sp. UMB4589-SE434]|uniref:CPBP family intramembrane glutamic endopeptidase n=1 Tax=Paenibacillus sp. UMB4589-SE434 TaxID=3046314 RepID=UPI002551C7D6|nr:CPBP family intramembrane glutamic endopeptidase [Paenibacillus sp. UMB4589-SE434]MDK8179807.1 CPBP family intramembrane metalloprotease [Paenibacillus sp. UMB4589-SE434]
MKQVAAVARVLMFVVLYVAVMFAVNAVLYQGAIYAPLHAFVQRNATIVMAAADLVALLLFAVLLPLFGTTLVRIGSFNRWNTSQVLPVIGLGLSLGVFILSFTRIPLIAEVAPSIANLVTFVAQGELLWLVLLNSAIIGTLFEEWLFRGIIYNSLLEKFNSMVAIIGQALLFGVVFMDVVVGSFAALGAILYALVRYFTGSLWPVLITHAASTTTIIVLSLLIDGTDSGVAMKMLIVSVLILVGCMAAIWRNGRRSLDVSITAVGK